MPHNGGRLLGRQELASSSSHLAARLGIDMAAANALITYLTAVESASRYIRISGGIGATDPERGAKTSAAATSDDEAREYRSSRPANPRRCLSAHHHHPRQAQDAPRRRLGFRETRDRLQRRRSPHGPASTDVLPSATAISAPRFIRKCRGRSSTPSKPFDVLAEQYRANGRSRTCRYRAPAARAGG